MMIRAVVLKQILWPQRQEDRNEGGWVEGDERMRSIDRAREVSIRRATLNRIQLLDEEQTARQSSMFKNGEEVLDFNRSDFAIKEREKAQLPTRGRKLQQQKQEDKK
jgi:predicted RNA polymerase sigma factor